MNPPAPGFPAREEGLALHLQLCDLNPTAVADVCRAYLQPLLDWLARQFGDIDADLRQMAAHDALFNYVQNPGSYKPDRGDLAVFLRMAARRDLWNLLQRERRHHRDRVAWDSVADAVADGNLSRDEEAPAELEQAEETRQWRDLLAALLTNFTEAERQVLDLMLAGERRTAEYALVLGLANLAPAEQEREVKKVKDRIKKRLQRGVPGHA
jgi:hypothetical protein